MSDNNDYLRTGSDSTFRLRADVMSLMLKGAGYAAIFCLAVWFSLAAIAWVGKLLPEESRETPDPTPFSFNLTDVISATV
tara:strand:- start:808 stop:1047 length:240 start_codon:yes stop_codon:yes gene_type:complete